MDTTANDFTRSIPPDTASLKNGATDTARRARSMVGQEVSNLIADVQDLIGRLSSSRRPGDCPRTGESRTGHRLHQESRGRGYQPRAEAGAGRATCRRSVRTLLPLAGSRDCRPHRCGGGFPRRQALSAEASCSRDRRRRTRRPSCRCVRRSRPQRRRRGAPAGRTAAMDRDADGDGADIRRRHGVSTADCRNLEYRGPAMDGGGAAAAVLRLGPDGLYTIAGAADSTARCSPVRRRDQWKGPGAAERLLSGEIMPPPVGDEH